MRLSGNRCTYKIGDYETGKDYAHCLDFMPDCVDRRATAFATCQFVLQAPESVGNVGRNWGFWVRTRMYTGGHTPSISHAWQAKGNWIAGDSIEAAESILQLFGISFHDVMEVWKPEPRQTVTVTLADIVAKFRTSDIDIPQLEALAV